MPNVLHATPAREAADPAAILREQAPSMSPRYLIPPESLGPYTEGMRILLVDDHRQVRHAVRKMLTSEPGWQVVAEAGDGNEGIRLAVDVQPDLVIVDASMQTGTNGVGDLAQRCPLCAPRRRLTRSATLHARC